MSVVSPSLLDVPSEPVLASASGWVTGLMSGSLAIALCVLAIAFVGFLLMSGRFAVRDALRVVLGCFVLLGAPAIALGLRAVATDTAQQGEPVMPAIIEAPPPPPLPQSTFDPYAGFSLPSD